MDTRPMGLAVVTGASSGIRAIYDPRVPDAGQGQAYESARRALLPNLSPRDPAARYGIVRKAG